MNDNAKASGISKTDYQYIYKAFEAAVGVCEYIEFPLREYRQIRRKADFRPDQIREVEYRRFIEYFGQAGMGDVSIQVDGKHVRLKDFNAEHLRNLRQHLRDRLTGEKHFAKRVPDSRLIADWDRFNKEARWSGLSAEARSAVRKVMAELYKVQKCRQWVFRQLDLTPLIEWLRKRIADAEGVQRIAMELMKLLGQAYLSAYLLNPKDFEGAYPKDLLKLQRMIGKLHKKYPEIKELKLPETNKPMLLKPAKGGKGVGLEPMSLLGWATGKYGTYEPLKKECVEQVNQTLNYVIKGDINITINTGNAGSKSDKGNAAHTAKKKEDGRKLRAPKTANRDALIFKLHKEGLQIEDIRRELKKKVGPTVGWTVPGDTTIKRIIRREKEKMRRAK